MMSVMSRLKFQFLEDAESTSRNDDDRERCVVFVSDENEVQIMKNPGQKQINNSSI